MQGLGLSDPKERQRYSKSHLNGNVVLHPTAGVRTDLRSEGAARLKSPALARIALIRAGLFAATLAALTGAPAFAALAPSPTSPQKRPTTAPGTSPMANLPNAPQPSAK